MKAVVFDAPRRLSLQEVAEPVCADDEVVIRTPIMGFAKIMRVMDSEVVNQAGENLARSTRDLSAAMKARVGGHVQQYGLLMAFGVFLIFLWAVTLL